MAEPLKQGEQVQLTSAWDIDPRSVPFAANQFQVQPGIGGDPQGIYLRVGHVNPPSFPENATPADIEAIGSLPIVTVGNFYLSLDMAKQLTEVLNQAMTQMASRAGE